MRKFTTILLTTLVCFAVCLSDVRADRLTAEQKAEYASANTSFGSFRICEDFNDSDMLYRIFNKYFETELDAAGQALYTSANDLFLERGVHEFVDSWHLNSGATISGSFRGAANEHTLTLLDSADQTVWSQVYQRNTYNTMNEAFMDTYYQIGVEGDYDITLSNTRYLGNTNIATGAYTLTGDGPNTGTLNGVTYDMINMIAIDVTDLMRLKLGDDTLESAYMFAWEDYLIGGKNGMLNDIDFDYNDIVYIVTNTTPNTTGGGGSTPEPATLLILGFAVAGGLPFTKRLRKAM